jgi:hypothetical protein
MSTRTTPRTYQVLHDTLEAMFSLHTDHTDLESELGAPMQLITREFRSTNWRVHPAEDEENTDPVFRRLVGEYIERFPYSERNFFHPLQPSDRDVPENLRFRYPLFVPSSGPAPYDAATVLLHGLNEKSWNKYLPWAARLAEQTGRPVILFPIAFHMNRAPRTWSNPREMIGVSRERRRLFPGVEASTFVNAALSHRVQFAPHRFVTSGLQSYYDVTDLVRGIRSGNDALFSEGARVDVFGYSIGATLAQLLLMSDPAGLFADSRAFLFCGGSVFDRTNPVSKAIMDGEAYRGLQGFLSRLVSNARSAVPRGVEVVRAGLWEVEVAKSLLFVDRLRSVREKAMDAISSRVAVLGMMKDRVFPSSGIEESWTAGNGRKIVDITVGDPAYAYAHERPFPVNANESGEVDRFFSEVMSQASAHLAV